MRMKSHILTWSFATLWAVECILRISRQFADDRRAKSATVLPGRIHRMSISTHEGSLYFVYVFDVPIWTATQFRAAIKSLLNHLA
eukprot:2518600-Heterocapsa_arctica.AAC.1